MSTNQSGASSPCPSRITAAKCEIDDDDEFLPPDSPLAQAGPEKMIIAFGEPVKYRVVNVRESWWKTAEKFIRQEILRNEEKKTSQSE